MPGSRICMHLISSLLFKNNVVMSGWMDMFILNQLVFIAMGQVMYFIFIKKDLIITRLDQIWIILILLYTTIQVDSLMIWSLFIVTIVFMVFSINNSILVNKYALYFGKYSFEIYYIML